jgi:hypothetical protein
MKRAGWIRAVALLSGVILAGRAEARDVDVPRAGRLGIGLLINPIVQGDLKLDAARTAKAKALVATIQERRNELYLKLEGLAGEARTAKIQEQSAILDEEAGKALAELLDASQLARLDQLVLQQRGASAWQDPAIARSLELTPEQAEKLAKVLDQERIRLREAPSNTRGDRWATTKKIHAIREETVAQAVALLTPEQAATWKKMTGEALDLNPAPTPRVGH